jgi:hypothetical protein
LLPESNPSRQIQKKLYIEKICRFTKLITITEFNCQKRPGPIKIESSYPASGVFQSMSTILHMQTEDVHQLAQQISWTASRLWDRVEETRHAAYRADWIGSDKEEFIRDMEACCQRLFQLLDELDQLGVRTHRESDQWEMNASHFRG